MYDLSICYVPIYPNMSIYIYLSMDLSIHLCIYISMPVFHVIFT